MVTYEPTPGSPAGKDDKKGKKRKVDANAPKGACSAYILFGNDARAAIKAEHPDWPPTEVIKEIGNRWKTLPAEEKSVYEDMQRADKKRYEAQMAEYKENGSYTAQSKLSSRDFGGKIVSTAVEEHEPDADAEEEVAAVEREEQE